ncbi:LPS export ABC transporter permease LptG [Pseudooceanicola sp.]|uniref:LPS export ABC transporter permease LptG n=1 Tax=Pseudooceanicola sp. TaxID=1914328 RepID=UPI00262E0C54|nr:LPS export ABC transporter permease LptG [Pseudooceanicola sp.]MDF1854162.1 LPS export ABC transporter permease LptG [Pseudooceanicola sp.]
MILHLYLARRFLRAFLALMLGLGILIVLIEMIEQVRRLNDTSARFGQVVEVALLHSPETLYEIVPLVTVLATVAMLIGLARSSELIVSRAAGRSALVSLMSPVLVAFVLGCLALAIMNPFVAATTKRYSALSDRYLIGSTSVLSISEDGLWLRQGGADGQTVIRAERANAEGTLLLNATFFAFTPEGGLIRRIEAQRAALVPGAWQLSGVKSWPLGADLNPEAQAVTLARLQIPSPLTIDRIRDSFGRPAAVAIWDLPAYAKALTQAGFSARRHLVWLQTELARPLFLMAMVMIAAAFTMRHARLGRVGLAVATSVLMGFSFYYIKNFAQILGENAQIPILAAAWAPPVAAVLLGIGLVLQMEDG